MKFQSVKKLKISLLCNYSQYECEDIDHIMRISELNKPYF